MRRVDHVSECRSRKLGLPEGRKGKAIVLRLFGCAVASLLSATACVGELDGSEDEYLVTRSPSGGSAGVGGVGGVGGMGGMTSTPDSGASGSPSSCPPIAQILEDNTCTNPACHGGANPQAMLKLDLPNPEDSLVGEPSTDPDCADRLLIDPQDPASSFLLEKLESSLPECGDPMPFGSKLPASEIECVRQWVNMVASSGG